MELTAELNWDSSGGNETQCNKTDIYSTTEKNYILLIKGSTGFGSFLTCVIAVALVFCQRLHRVFTYRLAMYQVLSALMFSCTVILDLALSVIYCHSTSSLACEVACKARSFLTVYFVWVKMIFTIILVFHLFCLAVFLKNFKYLEKKYILFSTLSPLLFTWIPFIHNTYGKGAAWCWIRDWTGKCNSKPYLEGVIEQYALWFIPLLVCVLVSFVAAIVIIVVVIRRIKTAHPERESLLPVDDLKRKNKKSLKELLPLLAYSTIFCLIFAVPLIHRILLEVHVVSHSFTLRMIHTGAIDSLGLFSSLMLITHVVVVQYLKRRKKKITDSLAETLTWNNSSNCTTRYLPPRESEIEKRFNFSSNS